MSPTLVVLLTVIGLVPVGGAADLPDAQEVLDRFAQAVGGRAALESLDVRQYRGTVVQDLSWKEPTHQERPFVAQTDAGGRVLFAESTLWADLPALDDGQPSRKLRWLMHPRFALVVGEFFPGLEVLGREIRNGRSAIVLVPASLPHDHYALYFDEETGLLSHIGYYDDLVGWHPEDGVLFPERFVFSRKGGHTTYLFTEVDAGPGIPVN